MFVFFPYNSAGSFHAHNKGLVKQTSCLPTAETETGTRSRYTTKQKNRTISSELMICSKLENKLVDCITTTDLHILLTAEGRSQFRIIDNKIIGVSSRHMECFRSISRWNETATGGTHWSLTHNLTIFNSDGAYGHKELSFSSTITISWSNELVRIYETNRFQQKLIIFSY